MGQEVSTGNSARRRSTESNTGRSSKRRDTKITNGKIKSSTVSAVQHQVTKTCRLKPSKLIESKQMLSKEELEMSRYCRLCTKYYRESENNDKACYHHHNRASSQKNYFVSQSTHMCCGASFGEKGCCLGYHHEDVTRTKTMDQARDIISTAESNLTEEQRKHMVYAFQSPDYVPPQEEPENHPNKSFKVRMPQYGEEDSDEEENDDFYNGYIWHKIEQNDTLDMLAKRYNTTVNTIKSINKLAGTDLSLRNFLYIPKGSGTRNPKESKKQIQKEKVLKEFINATQIDSKEAAIHYLEEQKWNIHKARTKYIEDLEWEHKRRMQQ